MLFVSLILKKSKDTDLWNPWWNYTRHEGRWERSLSPSGRPSFSFSFSLSLFLFLCFIIVVFDVLRFCLVLRLPRLLEQFVDERQTIENMANMIPSLSWLMTLLFYLISFKKITSGDAVWFSCHSYPFGLQRPAGMSTGSEMYLCCWVLFPV